MTVYVDALFGLNTIINYLLLRGSAAIGGCPVRRLRLLGAAVLGGLYAVAGVLPGLYLLQRGVFQFLCAAVMTVLAFGLKTASVKQGLFFLALSFALSGLVLLAVQVLEPDLVLLGGRAYYAVSTPALLLLAGLSYGLAAAVLANCGAHTGGDVVPMILALGDHAVTLRALRDTGNTLRDPISGQSVVVTGWQTLSRLLPEAAFTAGQFRDPATLLRELAIHYPAARFRLIPYRAVGVEGGLLLAVRCRGTVKGKSQSLLVAFSPAGLTGGQFEAVWGGAIT